MPIKSPRALAHTHTHRAEKDMEEGGGGHLKARAVIKEQERERESSRFVQQKSHYWAKYCLKRSVLRLVLKAGMEGL